MKAVLQRVSSAQVIVAEKKVASIQNGVLVLLGVAHEDTLEDAAWLSRKIAKLRIFDDADTVMNTSLLATKGDVIVVSQFTLQASTKKGNRPSYIQAAHPAIAKPLYEQFVNQLSVILEKKVQTGVFGAHMEVSLVNDGPVTIVLDSKNKI